MVVTQSFPRLTTDDRLAGRAIRIGVVIDRGPLVEYRLAPDADVRFGAAGDAVVVPGWDEPDLCVVERGRWLALGSGMSINACHENGEDRMEGSYEELVAAGVGFPFFINVARLNITIRTNRLEMLMEYVRPGS